LTAFITVPIAAKRLTFAWRTMTHTKGAHTHCILRNDPRLIAGVGAVVSHAAERAGLVQWDQTEFANAAEEACRETLASLAKVGMRQSDLQLLVDQFAGRVEITIEPATGNGHDTRALEGRAAVKAVEGVCRTLERKGVDRVLCETLPHSFRMKLIKYSAGPKSAASD
jgi:hypothetical protein